MPVRVHCPFCNAATVLPVPATKALCVRCGESFAPSQYESADGLNVAAPKVAKRTSQLPFFLGIALLGMIGAGIAYWQPWKSSTPTIPQDTKPSSIKPPLALDGLKYLSPASNITFAVQPAALAAYAERTGTDVKTVLAKLGLPKQAIDSLDRLGIPLTNIDHLAAGMTLAPDKLIPDITIVLKLRQPIEEDAFLKSLHAEKKPRAGRAIYRSNWSPFGLPMLIAPVDNTTYLLGLSDEDVSLIESGKPLSDNLRKTISERLSPASFAWLATENRDWSDAHPALKSEQLQKLKVFLAPARGISLGMSLEPDPTLQLTLELRDDAAASAAETALKAKMAATTVTCTGSTVVLQSPATAEAMDALTKMLSDVWK